MSVAPQALQVLSPRVLLLACFLQVPVLSNPTAVSPNEDC